MVPDSSPFLTVPEVAALLRQPISWVYEQSRMHLIPSYKGGKRLLFDREEVLAWFKEAHQRGPLPNTLLGSRRGKRAGRVRVSVSRGVAVALPVPSDEA